MKSLNAGMLSSVQAGQVLYCGEIKNRADKNTQQAAHFLYYYITDFPTTATVGGKQNKDIDGQAKGE